MTQQEYSEDRFQLVAQTAGAAIVTAEVARNYAREGVPALALNGTIRQLRSSLAAAMGNQWMRMYCPEEGER